ncbi:MAG: trypsin-like peptidase domain-containing protein [Streptosporangiaceae bacterium]|nr:trypsin-like peptidase domain-containing protein [Streptosporangiaceae bacterium]MBV9854859.1 trypsin-like peptidase domain-containing protein [Streptosporangiaceae bacterium]
MTLALGRLSAVRLGKKRQLGSVFAVTRRLALTSFHCVRNDTTATVMPHVLCEWQQGETSEATVQAWDERIDVALLRLSRALPDSFDPVPLTGDVASHDPFVAPGAPAALSELQLAAVSGTVLWPNASMPDGSPALELFCQQVRDGLSLHGLSGAPVLTGNMERAVGVIRWNPQQTDRPELAAGGLVYAAPAREVLKGWPNLTPPTNWPELVRRMTERWRASGAADLYADVRRILLVDRLGLCEDDLSVIPAAHGGRSRLIAIDMAQTVVGVEPGLSRPNVRAGAERELADAVATRTAYAGRRYAAVLTDGVSWYLYHYLAPNQLQVVDTANVDLRAPGKLLVWLEALLATATGIKPDRDQIDNKLGAKSSAHHLDTAELTAIYQAHRDVPTVKIKRRLWAKLLTTASGTDFGDEDSLFVTHTLLVATAKVIGHAVLGFHLDGPEMSASVLMSGTVFSSAGITGAIEADFFDWVTEVPGGEQFVMNLAQRLSRFDWRQVDHDVLKQIYESVIPRPTRHQLGEYYTPDWLAEAIIADRIERPLVQRMLDPSCGSGTFLFHAIRSYLKAADQEGMTTAEAINGLTRHVIGIDVHPVAVTLARVTYLLAIGTHRLQRHRQEFAVPVFLGDSMRWGHDVGHDIDLLTYDYEGLAVSTRLDPESFVTGSAAPSQPEFDMQLNFPDRVAADANRFDQLVSKLADMATRRQRDDPCPPLEETFELFDIRTGDQSILKQTFERMCKLRDNDEDHIWGYYVRNLARPAWLARPANRVDALVGNPPWLYFRHMTRRQQGSFKRMCEERGLWSGGGAATNQDLSALFVARCIERYLQPEGRFGFVMPWAVLPRPGQDARRPHSGFRKGTYTIKSGGTVKVAFTKTWDLKDIKPAFFPLKACVVLGHRQQASDIAIPLPERANSWAGRFDTEHATWAEAAPHISILDAEPLGSTTRQSPYASRFTQGATIVPRVLFLVNPGTVNPLGTVAGQRPVRSRRSPTEKSPWKLLDDLTGAVETEFIRPVYTGESVLPFLCLPPLQAVIPWDGHRLLRDGDLGLGRHPGLADWLHKAETAWMQHRSSERLSLTERLDYRRGVTQQFPIAKHRVVYGASGTYLAATIIEDSSAIIEHRLYWAATASLDEARYLTAILNSSALTIAVRPMQTRGEHNPRHFDKYVFQLAIPRYDPADAAHARLVVLAERAARIAATTTLPRVRFERQRKHVRDALERDGIAQDIDAIVKALLDITI